MSRKKPASVAVIGLGTFGRTIALELSRLGNHVLALDVEDRPVNDIADKVAEAVVADSRDEEALHEAGLASYEAAVVAIGEDLEANILCTMNLKKLGVETIWVKSVSPTHHRILRKLGADRVIEPEQEIGQHVAQWLTYPQVRDYLSLGNGFHVVHVEVPEAFLGQSLDRLGIEEKFSIRCLGVIRAWKYLECVTVDLELAKGDHLLLLGKLEDLMRFGKSL